jgi:hypothetical protein
MLPFILPLALTAAGTIAGELSRKSYPKFNYPDPDFAGLQRGMISQLGNQGVAATRSAQKSLAEQGQTGSSIEYGVGEGIQGGLAETFMKGMNDLNFQRMQWLQQKAAAKSQYDQQKPTFMDSLSFGANIGGLAPLFNPSAYLPKFDMGQTPQGAAPAPTPTPTPTPTPQYNNPLGIRPFMKAGLFNTLGMNKPRQQPLVDTWQSPYGRRGFTFGGVY